MRGLVRDMKAAIRKYGDILSPEAIQEYFLETYWRVGDEGLDSLGIVDLFKMSLTGTVFSYRTASEKFKLVDSENRSVIIANTQEARDALRMAHDGSIRSVTIARQLQTHIVQIPQNAFDRLLKEGKISSEAPTLRDQEFVVLRDASLYTPDHGLIWEA
jgi:CRISPR-associated endonuclease/helicase Cas3